MATQRRNDSPKSNPNPPDLSRRGFLARLGALGTMAGVAGPALACEAALARAGLDALRGVDGPRWNKVRAQFLLPDGLVYLNNGTLGPCPAHVINEAVKAWREMERDPAGEGFGPGLRNAEHVRQQAAVFLGCDPNEVALVRNTTEGMNTVAQGLDLRAAQRVLTTDQEHPGGLVGWQYYAKRRGVIIDTIRVPTPPQDPAQVVALVESRLRPSTRVISISHVTFSTGLRMPIQRIAALARANGSLLVVDGAQAPGVLDVRVKQLDCDTYATSAHKWMLAPKGCGLLYINRRAKDQVRPLLLQHGYRAYTASTGTRNIPAIIGLGAAMDFLGRIGRPAIQKRALELRRLVYERLGTLRRVRVLSPPDGPLASAMVSFALPAGVRSRELAKALKDRHHVIVKVLPRAWGESLRISLHVYNTASDVEKLVAALRHELG